MPTPATSQKNLGFSTRLFVGGGNAPGMQSINKARGAPVNLLSKLSLGSPVAANATGIVNGATSTELPNAATVTYTPANNGSSPCDDAGVPTAVTNRVRGQNVLVWPMVDAGGIITPRALTVVVTHSTAVVACSVLLSGYDLYSQPMTETFTVTAGTASKTVAGKKAFAYLASVAVTAAADATANTMTVGWNDKLGLPYPLSKKQNLVSVWFNDTIDATPTVVLADATTATATTGDVRGTIDTTSAANGSEVVVWMNVADPNTATGLAGVAQA